jgi:hypothetical protein
MRSERETDAHGEYLKRGSNPSGSRVANTAATPSSRCSVAVAAPLLSLNSLISNNFPRPYRARVPRLRIAPALGPPARARYLSNGRYRRTDVRATTEGNCACRMKHENCGYENVVFCRGVDASEPLEKLSERG